MSHYAVSQRIVHHNQKKNFLGFLFWLAKNFYSTTLSFVMGLFLFMYATFSSFPKTRLGGPGGLFIFFFEFIASAIKEFVEFSPFLGKFFGGILGGFIVYLVAEYCTFLPIYIAIPLAFLPKKIAFPVVGLSMLMSLFIVFLV